MIIGHALLLVLTAAGAAVPPRVLTLQEALATARERQPQVRQAVAATAAAAARSDEALSGLLPQLGGSAEYQRETAPPSSSSSSAASGTGASYNYYTFGLSASQLLYDFGQTSKKWRAAQGNELAQRDSEKTTMALVVFNVRTAFFQARAARGLVDVAKETLADQQKHLEQTQGFVDVGTQPAIALAQAKTGVANAQVQLITAENGYLTAKAQLNQAMGVEGPLDYDVANDSAPPVEGESGSLEPLVDEAARARPEMVVLTDQIHAQELTIRSIQGGYGPSLGLSAGLTEIGEQVNDLTWNWNTALTLTVPIWSGGLTKAQVREAKANLESLRAQLAIERLQVKLDVEQAVLAVRAARETIAAAEDALVNAREQLRLAEGRYAVGIGSIIELTDAQVAYTSAGQQKVQADYGLAQARAQLVKALGRD